MATDKQIQANRRNSKLSTGPKSKEALEQLGQRNRRHSLAGAHMVLPYEKAEDYDALRDYLYTSFSPANTHECILVDHIAQQHWKLERAHRLERAHFTTQQNSAIHAMQTVAAQSTDRTVIDPDRALAMAISQDPAQLLLFHRYAAAIVRALRGFTADLRAIQNDRRREEQHAAPSEQSPNPEIDSEALTMKSEPPPIPKPASVPPPLPAPGPRFHQVDGKWVKMDPQPGE